MASPLGHALAVRVEDGRAFPRDGGAAFRVVATFDEEPRTTVRRDAYRAARCALRVAHAAEADALRRATCAAQPFAKPSTSPFWGATLSWEVDPERLRRVTATGTGQLKLTGARRSGRWRLRLRATALPARLADSPRL
jgi:hypothetical protein